MATVHFPLLQDYSSTIPGIQCDNSIVTKYGDSTDAIKCFWWYSLTIPWIWTILWVSCESSDFWSIFHCFHPSVCRICTIGDICFPPFYKAIKHLQKLRSKGEDIRYIRRHSFALALTATSAHLFGGWEDWSANVNKYTCQPCVMKSCASEQSHMIRKI